jgi:hypothetical protein
MSSTDKTKLDGIESGAEINQNAFSIFAVENPVGYPAQDDVVSDTKTDTVKLVGGMGIRINTDSTTDSITFDATGDVFPANHASTHAFGGSDALLTNSIAGSQIKSSASVDSDRAISTDHIKDLAVTDAKIDTMLATKLTGTIDNARLNTATTSSSGIVQLNDTLTSTSTTQALTANQGKALQDGKLSLTGGTVTGDTTFSTAKVVIGSTGGGITSKLDVRSDIATTPVTIRTGLQSNNTSTKAIEIYSDNSNGASSIDFVRGSSSASGGIAFSTSTGGVKSEAVRIRNDGFVSIGVGNPTEKLDVSGNIKSSGTISAGTTITAGTGITATTGNITATNGNITVSNGNVNVTGNIQTTGTGTITSASTVQGTRLISTVASGTAPFTVSSSTVVANLNADLLDGYSNAGISGSKIMTLFTDNAGATTSGTTYVDVPASIFLWDNQFDFNNRLVYFEVVLLTPAGITGNFRLSTSGGTAVTTISQTGSSASRFRSAAINLTDNTSYKVQISSATSGQTVTLYAARLIVI